MPNILNCESEWYVTGTLTGFKHIVNNFKFEILQFQNGKVVLLPVSLRSYSFHTYICTYITLPYICINTYKYIEWFLILLNVSTSE